jgi:hypothetical protein
VSFLELSNTAPRSASSSFDIGNYLVPLAFSQESGPDNQSQIPPRPSSDTGSYGESLRGISPGDHYMHRRSLSDTTSMDHYHKRRISSSSMTESQSSSPKYLQHSHPSANEFSNFDYVNPNFPFSQINTFLTATEVPTEVRIS